MKNGLRKTVHHVSGLPFLTPRGDSPDSGKVDEGIDGQGYATITALPAKGLNSTRNTEGLEEVRIV